MTGLHNISIYPRDKIIIKFNHWCIRNNQDRNNLSDRINQHTHIISFIHGVTTCENTIENGGNSSKKWPPCTTT